MENKKFQMDERSLQKVEVKSAELFAKAYHKLCVDNDRVFGVLFIIQWIAAIVVALTVTPLTWIGDRGLVNVHVYASIFIGALLTLFPIYLYKINPGAKVNRYANVIAQALYSILFIHLTGGRIETHFHVFGSLAFFAFYRDIRLLIVGSLVVTVDHMVRGVWFPQSAFGMLSANEWRWIEHGCWVAFENMFLGYSCIRSLREMKIVAFKTAEATIHYEHAEEIVIERTKQIDEQQVQLIQAAKLSSLGEMAAGIAHEINNPLSIIAASNKVLRRNLSENPEMLSKSEKYLDNIDKTVQRMVKIIQGLRNVSRDAAKEEFDQMKLADLMNDVITLCSERFKSNGITLTIDLSDPVYQEKIHCRPVQLSQVFINLLSNAYDAVESLPERWVKIDCSKSGNKIIIKVTDSGQGIPKEIQEKIFQPFFTTKGHGKGTGLGLSLSITIIRDHHGVFSIDNRAKNTCFVVELPHEAQDKKQAA